MQLFSTDATIFKKEIYIYFFDRENLKKAPSKIAHNRLQFFFQYCQPAQNQLKSHILFHKEWLLARLLYNDFDISYFY